MKKFFIVLCATLSLTSCSYVGDMVTLHRELTELQAQNELNQQRVESLSSSLVTLTALAEVLSEGFYIQSITPVTEGGKEVGYTIIFTNNKQITIYHGKDGNDAASPKIAIKLYEDGKYYWTIDGSWAKDPDGKMIPVSSQDTLVPKVEIRDGFWYISFDLGKSWQLLGRATGEDGLDGDDGIETIIKVDCSSEDFVTFVLADGTSFIVPYKKDIKITLDMDGDVAMIGERETIRIGYTLSGADGKTYVAVESDGYYTAVVTETSELAGYIDISCPRTFDDGHINVLVYASSGIVDAKVITFNEKVITLRDGTEYTIDYKGGTIDIPLVANFTYTAVIDDGAKSWLAVTGTQNDGQFSVRATRNNGAARSGLIYIYSKNSLSATKTITVTQNSESATIDKGSFVFTYEGGTGTANVKTQYGVSAVVPDADKEWARVQVNTGASEDEYVVLFSINANYHKSERSCEVKLMSQDGSKELATVKITQSGRSTDVGNAMIVIGKPNYSNDFTVALPINLQPYYSWSQSIDFYVEWGDGTGTHYTKPKDYSAWEKNPYPMHQYKDVVPGSTYEIAITGTVPSFRANNVSDSYKTSITAIRQWGNLGTVNMREAFSGYSSIESLPLDENGAFAQVSTFWGAFRNCTGLKSVSGQLFANATGATNFEYIFEGCVSLASLPSNLFSGCGNATNMYGAFRECSALQSVPEDLFNGCSKVEDMSYIFGECTSLKSLPKALFSHCSKLEKLNGAFYYCKSLSTIPSGLFDNCTNLSNIEQIFQECNSITSLPTNLFDKNRSLMYFYWAFSGLYNCKSESPYTVIDGKKVHLYERSLYQDYFICPVQYEYCFQGCHNMADYESIPDSWKNN